MVFADVTASTALAERLDPESFHDVLDQYCATCTSAVERHGGRVDKFIGDAVVGVFGLPTVHEDDALRAVRAALEIRSAVAALSETLMRERGIELGVAVGVNTGEVFAAPGAQRRSSIRRATRSTSPHACSKRRRAGRSSSANRLTGSSSRRFAPSPWDRWP